MAMAETPNPNGDRHSRRKPFSSWVKRLTSLKSSSSESHPNRTSGKRSNGSMLKGKKQNGFKNNNPYPLSGNIGRAGSPPHSYNDTVSYTESTGQTQGHASSQLSLHTSVSEHNILGNSAKSTAPTLSTNGDTARSEAGYSKAGTMATGHGGTTGGGEGSTFSSPAPSVRSLTTTLTTVQSTAPSTQIYGAYNNQAQNGSSLPHVNSTYGAANQQVHFSHQFPSSPAPAVPPHLAPNGQPTTYTTAIANNLLTDNASILTLASSSKRRRRNSLDTNASVRALAPSSVFGGSRESLPLSVLSGNVGDTSNASVSNAPGVLSRQSLGGLASAERISVYSASGATTLITGGDRGSLITSKQGDNGSIRSSLHGHTRNDSTTGSITGSALPNNNTNTNNPPAATTTAASNPNTMPGRISRRSSGWGEISGESEGAQDEEEHIDTREKAESSHEERATGEELNPSIKEPPVEELEEDEEKGRNSEEGADHEN
ncbi:hypothetical protein BGW36DRAFT_164866 [Talaromyces proteolyticus]|uniref:Uncharacterized protein n=1 Tax=Talaromyces proteolyticus TaxID=1131652 RepID=A0AAD4PY27_9EURO|nr:uncharacterized protein BGW36DRAFT_164866 [Talaromyces proteolyticus]KAH8697289.1 hypothetical protein BGW36DRAFT_164866 [Talaromyces proteolyticus]